MKNEPTITIEVPASKAGWVKASGLDSQAVEAWIMPNGRVRLFKAGLGEPMVSMMRMPPDWLKEQ